MSFAIEMAFRRVSATLTAVILLGAGARADELCQEQYDDLTQLEDRVKAKPDVQVLPSDGTVVSILDPATGFIWNFATPKNAAFPSVACRYITKSESGYTVATDIRCLGEKVVCDALANDYQLLDQRMKGSLNSRQ